MKRRKYLLTSVILLCCLFLILLVRHKQKDVRPVESNSSNGYIDKEIGDLDVTADSTIPESRLTTVKPKNSNGKVKGGNAASSVGSDSNYQRRNLLFNFTAEAPGSLTELAENSLTSWNSLGACCVYSIQRSSDYARSGEYAIRYELNNTDPDVAGSKRAESSRYSHDEPNGNIERWYGASYFLPDDYETDPAPELLTQWQSLKGINPPLSLWTLNGKWFIVEHIDAGETRTVIDDCRKNVWTDFVFHVKWSTGEDGFIEVWKDGVKVFTRSGANTYLGITTGNYMKTGIYKWPWKKTNFYTSVTSRRIIYIDDVRIGNEFASYNDVAPGRD